MVIKLLGSRVIEWSRVEFVSCVFFFSCPVRFGSMCTLLLPTRHYLRVCIVDSPHTHIVCARMWQRLISDRVRVSSDIGDQMGRLFQDSKGEDFGE